MISEKHHYPAPRILITDAVAQGNIKNHIPGLVELDVTAARRKIKSLRRTKGQSLSLLAWLLQVIAQTVREFPLIQGYLLGKNQVQYTENMDFCIIVERTLDGQAIPLTWMLRNAQSLNVQDIEDSLQQARNCPLPQHSVSINEPRPAPLNRLLYALPGGLRRLLWRILLSRPQWARQAFGTIHVTSVGMMGRVNGWFIQSTVQPLSFGFNALNRKPRAIGDKVEIRDILNTTVLFDHDIVDGAVMVRFMSRLLRRVEKGDLLDK